jgi:hypothetical protein
MATASNSIGSENCEASQIPEQNANAIIANGDERVRVAMGGV